MADDKLKAAQFSAVNRRTEAVYRNAGENGLGMPHEITVPMPMDIEGAQS